MGWTIRGSNSYWGRRFFFSETSGQALRSTKHPFHYAPVVFPGGQCGRGVKLTTPLHLPPRLSKRGVIPPTPPYPISYYGLDRDDLTFCFILSCASYIELEVCLTGRTLCLLLGTAFFRYCVHVFRASKLFTDLAYLPCVLFHESMD
jgi:hypothetical protein